MAHNATIFKAHLQIADMDRNYYGDHALVMARHPSETDERMMVRLLAFALNASESLVFGKGLSSEDEPDLWQKDLTGQIELWVDVGQPDEKTVRKAGGRASRVRIYNYGLRSADAWWNQVRARLQRQARLSVTYFPQEATRAIAALADRNMQLQCTIQQGQIWLSGGDSVVEITPLEVFPAT
jgi:uncharacterized protein YaeQ